MNRPRISISDAVRLALRYARIENDEPCCVSAVYEDGLFALVVYTAFQKNEFYVDGFSGEIAGMNSEPYWPDTDENLRICA